MPIETQAAGRTAVRHIGVFPVTDLASVPAPDLDRVEHGAGRTAARSLIAPGAGLVAPAGGTAPGVCVGNSDASGRSPRTPFVGGAASGGLGLGSDASGRSPRVPLGVV